MEHDQPRVDWTLLVMIVQVPVHLGRIIQVIGPVSRSGSQAATDGAAATFRGRRLQASFDYFKRTRHDRSDSPANPVEP